MFTYQQATLEIKQLTLPKVVRIIAPILSREPKTSIDHKSISRTTGLISTKLAIKNPLVKEFLVCSNKGLFFLKEIPNI